MLRLFRKESYGKTEGESDPLLLFGFDVIIAPSSFSAPCFFRVLFLFRIHLLTFFLSLFHTLMLLAITSN